jgi:ATP-dependent Clp protease adaptor protein ClpS
MSNTNTKENTKTNTKTVTIVKPREHIITPKMYKILLHNNDVTSFEGVMEVLKNIYNKSHQEGQNIMMTAHRTGVGLVLRSTKDICETKLLETRNFINAHMNDELFPGRPHFYEFLEFSMEEDE